MINNRYVILFFRLVLGGVFIWAGVLKVSDPLGFAQSIANYRAFPLALAFFLALILPWVEIICGLFLILGVLRRASAVILSALHNCLKLILPPRPIQYVSLLFCGT